MKHLYIQHSDVVGCLTSLTQLMDDETSRMSTDRRRTNRRRQTSH